MPSTYAIGGSGMAKSDTRYLKRQHQSWYFVTAVPKALRGRFLSEGRKARGGRRHPGKPLNKIVVSLGTQSLADAQEKRWPLVTEWREKFQRALSGTPLTGAEIDAEARDLYHYLLDWMEQHKKADREEEANNIDVNLDIVAEALENESWKEAETEVRRIERRKGREIERGSPTHILLARALLTARLEACEGRLHLLRGQPSEEPATFLGADGLDPKTLRPIVAVARPKIRLRDSGGMRFSEAAARYIEAKRKAGKMTGHTQRQRETVFRLFKEFTRDAPLAAIDKLTATEFLEQIGKLDPKWHNIEDAQELPLAKLVEKGVSRAGKLTNRTINSYIHALSGVFKLADRDGHFEGRNPFAGRTLEETYNSWRAYKVEELNKLFSTALLREMPAEQRIRPDKYSFETAMAWIPLVALFSGMRSNEICQMRASDVHRKDGVWVFNVSEEGTGQSLKTEAATRIVPVHSELIRCGFLDYVKALPRDGQLWPALKAGGPDGKYNHYFAKRFTVYRRGSGVAAPRTSFHSFRKNVAQALKDKRATPAEIAELIGHEQGFTLSVYAPMQLPIKVLKQLIDRVRYPGLRLHV
jgi:integrase